MGPDVARSKTVQIIKASGDSVIVFYKTSLNWPLHINTSGYNFAS